MRSDQLAIQRQKLRGSLTNKYMGAIKYKGELIAQWHNPKLFIDDIIGENDTKQFTSILLIGSPGTGKTTLSTFIAHQIHNQANYFVYHFGRQELLKFDQVINNLPNQNIVLIFDDVSLIFKNIKDPAQRTKILTTLTEARHPNLEKTERKVIVIANIHYMNSIEKMWRSQGSWKFYTDMSADEADVFNHMTKSRFKKKVEIFTKITLDQFRRKKFTISLTNKQEKTYHINNPFRFIMCYDNSSLRFFLVPEEFCNYCSKDSHKLMKTQATPDEIIQLCYKYYKDDGIAGLKLALLLAGQTMQYRNNPIYGFNTAKEILSIFDVSHEDLALKLRDRAKITDKRLYTIRKKQINFVEDLKSIRAKNVSPLGSLEQQTRLTDEIDLDL